MPLPLADGFETSARLACGLATRPEVTARWTDESACAGMSIGGLANHLVAQVDLAVGLLSAPPSELAPIPVAEHYRRAAWAHSALDEEANTTIRESADAEAGSGSDALAARAAAGLEALPDALAAADGREPDSVLLPWQGWALTAHDLTVTRLMEMMVHADDLAASTGVETPQFPGDVVAAVLALLAVVAADRHGQTALVRALARPQRAPGQVSAFG
ncbi:MAG TPA: maleylpyruvate isomerase N-terminal domain-containing protein [Nocardioides sp.]|uniref:maleylpyruvate isomerase N-terminal domain-containing protein n=1 Tax=Nocardioides sp. TaxID=35761 RepID=UPI002E374685|nr:maleylpyruvate isomerase N-terminal domain-containing protein [Nocardioides sp.]HEX5086742.1 maleylpyruvate isomerase N-terminal domain-containing protein [Nocardioides sp.]